VTAKPFAIVALSSAWLACTLGGSPCGLRLQQRLYLSATTSDVDVRVPCCGGSVYRDVDLRRDGLEVDISNLHAAGSAVDAFLTDVGCDKLFDTYSGNSAGTRCTVYIGPVSPREVSARRKIAAGRYRLFAQAWTSNQSPVAGSLELGIWSDDCRWTPISPALH
jgi:hypothetical protein